MNHQCSNCKKMVVSRNPRESAYKGMEIECDCGNIDVCIDSNPFISRWKSKPKKKNKVLLKLKDGYISDINDDFDTYEGGGCPTCGYETEYTSEISFKLIHDVGIEEWHKVESTDYYSFKFSVADILRLFIENMDNMSKMEINEFKTWIDDKLLG